jgi:hypothetical protein
MRAGGQLVGRSDCVAVLLDPGFRPDSQAGVLTGGGFRRTLHFNCTPAVPAPAGDCRSKEMTGVRRKKGGDGED